MQWYYAVGDQRQGPIEQAEFDQLVAAGTIKGSTLVWRQGMSEWQPYSTVGGAVPVSSAPAVDDGTEMCAVSGKRYPRREMIQYEGKWISAEHRDAYFQRLREGVMQPSDGAVPGPFGYGGMLRRWLARFLDNIIIQIIAVVIGLLGGVIIGAARASLGSMIAMQGITVGLIIAVVIGYEIFFIRKFDATPGKMAVGVKILRTDGSKLSVGRIVGRFFGNIVSTLTLGIGYIMGMVDEEKRTLHDRMCDTRVIKTR